MSFWIGVLIILFIVMTALFIGQVFYDNIIRYWNKRKGVGKE
tara:strand:- start:1 stop:126 length:126 start_codon:yes stop_codon:yes gene_type:complete